MLWHFLRYKMSVLVKVVSSCFFAFFIIYFPGAGFKTMQVTARTLQASIFIIKLSGAVVLPKCIQWQIGLQLPVLIIRTVKNAGIFFSYNDLPDEAC